MPLYSYVCECGFETEEFNPSDIMEIQCQKCQKLARRSFPVPQSPKMGLTNADGRIRDKMKRAPKSAAPSARFDRGDPRKKF